MRKYIINPFTGLLDCIGVDTPTPPIKEYIIFEDAEVERICIENWSSDGIGLTYEDAAAVTDLNNKFCYYGETPPQKQITSFNEFQYFTGIISLGQFNPSSTLGEFMGATELKSIILPSNLQVIGFMAFQACASISEFIIPNSVHSIAGGSFINMRSLTSIIIPNSVTAFGNSIFSNSINLDSVILPIEMELIPSELFFQCSSLTTIEIPNSVKSIGFRAFFMSGLITIDIPDSVISIGEAAFSECLALNTIICRSINPPLLHISAFEYSTNIANIFVPAESVDAYKTAEGWSTYADKITAIV